MLLFENNEETSLIYRRAISLLISRNFAHTQKGEIFVATYQDSEQANPRRELLEVEQVAKQNKTIEEHGQNEFKKQVSVKLLAKVKKQVIEQLENKDVLYNQIMKIDQAACDILEILSLNAASIKRITPLVTALPWLSADLLKLVNKPQYRKRSDVQITDAAVAVGYIGLNNLRLVMPSFILKHWLPETDTLFQVMKRKLWQTGLSTALATQMLAKLHKIDEYSAFTAGMLSNIGLYSIVRCFNKTYQTIHDAAMKNAYEKRDKRLHDALKNIEITPDLLLELISKYSHKITGEMVESMRFDRLTVTEPLYSLSFQQNHEKLSKLSTLVLKAHAYIHHRTLQEETLIEQDESDKWLAINQLTKKEMYLLDKANIDQIKLQFN